MTQAIRFVRLLQQEVEKAAKVRKSLQFLAANRSLLDPYRDLEEYVFRVPDPLPKGLRGFEFHFGVIKWRLIKTLRVHQIFIGPSIIEEFLFPAIKDAALGEPVKQVLERIRDSGIHQPGIVLFPLHSFGIAGAGIFELMTKSRVHLTIPAAGLAVRAQTNSLKGTIDFLRDAASQLNVRRTIPIDSLEHYERLTVLSWLTHNPLLIIKARAFAGTYYENQEFVIIKLKIATTILFILSSFESSLSAKAARWGSTRYVNNFQTLDIKHYVILEPWPGSPTRFQARRVPMNVDRAELAELSAVPIEIARGGWMRRKKLVATICEVLLKIESGYLKYRVYSEARSATAIMYRKLFESLAYFRRSFRLATNPDEAYVNLAVAFEVLLTDMYAPGVAQRIKERLKVTLRHVKGARNLYRATEKIYVARSEVVHSGHTELAVDLQAVRQAFIFALLFVVKRLDGIPPGSQEPVKAIIGV